MLNSNNIEDAILNGTEGDSISEAIINGTGEDPTEAILNYNTATRNTEMAQEIYGEDYPFITHVEDLHNIDQIEAEKIAEENTEAAVAQDMEKVFTGKADAKYVDARAKDMAVQYYKTLEVDPALAVSNARQLAANAEIDSAAITGLDSDYKKELANIQTKTAFITEFFTRMAEEKNQDGLLKRIARDFGHALTYSLPGADAALSSEAAGAASAGFWHPVENEHRIHEMWWGAALDKDITLEQLSELANQYNAWLDSKGFSKAEKSDAAIKILDRMPNLAKWVGVFDLAGLGGAAASVGKATVKGAVKGGTKAAVRSAATALAKEVTEAVAPVKSFAKEGGIIERIGAKISDSKLGRALFYGDKERAVKEIIDNLPAPSLKRDMVEIETETGRQMKTQSIAESYVGNAIDVGETVESHVATSGKILTEKGVRQLGKKIMNAVDYLSKEAGSLKQMEQQTWADIAKKVAIDYDKPEWAELIKAVPAKDLGSDVQGNIVVRIRHPKEFSNVGEAKFFIENLDTPNVDAKIFKNTSGTYSVDLDLNTNYGFMDISKDKKDGWTNRFKSSVATFSSVPTDIREADMARIADTTTLKSIFAEAQKSYDDLSALEKDLANAIYARTVQDKAFYRPEDLLKANVPENVVDFISRTRAAGDVEFFMRNDGIKQLFNRMGIKSLVSPDGTIDYGYGRIQQFSSYESFKERLIGLKDKHITLFDDPEKKPVKISSIIDNDKLREAFAINDLVIVETTIGKGKDAKRASLRMIAPRDAISEAPLPAFVLNYLPGGHRFFERGAGFIKQLDIQNGVIFGTKTVMVDMDKTGLLKRREGLEALRMAFVNKSDDLAINSLIKQHNMPFENAAEARKFFTDKGLDIDNADNVFEVLNHGELPSLYKNNMKAGWYEDLLGTDLMEYEKSIGEYREAFFDPAVMSRSKVDRSIVDYAFNPITTVDLGTMFRYVIDDLQDLGIMRTYAEMYAKKFYNEFRELANLDTGARNPLDFLLNTNFEKQIKGETNPRKKALMSAAITAQKNFEVLRGIPSDLDSKVSSIFDAFVRGIAGFSADALKINDDIRHRVRVNYAEIFKKDKSAIVSTATTHFFLGMGNYTQFLKNIVQPLTVTMVAEPVAGAKAFKHLHSVISQLNGVDGALLKKVKMLHDLEGISSSEDKILLQNVLKVGLDLSHVKGGAVEPIENMSTLGKASMFFFNKADTINKTHSLLTALISKGFDKKLLTTADEINLIRSYRDTLFMNMDRSGMSRLQQSQLVRIATQFQSATMRAFETFCFDRNLTRNQKIRLWTMQLALGGTLSVWGGAHVFTDKVFEKLEGDEGLDPTLQEVKATIETGIVDAIVRAGGYNFAASRFWQMGIGDLTEDVLDLSTMGLIQQVPAVSAAGKFLDGLTTMTNWTYNKIMNRPVAEFSNMLKILARKGDLSTVPNKLEAAYSLMTTGAMYNSRGELSTEDNRLLSVVTTALGLNDQNMGEIYRAKLREQKEKDRVAQFVKKWGQSYLEYSAAGDEGGVEMIYNDLSNKDFTMHQKSSIMKMLNEKAVEKRLTPMFERSLIKRLNDKPTFGKQLMKTNR